MSTVYDGEPSDWLRAATVGYESSIEDSLVIPMNHEGNPFVPEALYPEQQQTLYPIVDKIREWMTCDDLSKFETACFTVCGKGGTGKTILLNTLTAVLRQLFGYNNVVATTGPTGSSAFNAFGETLHRFAGLGIRGEYKPNTLKLASQERLRARCKHLLCLIIDERSLLSSQLLGSTAQVISEVIFDGAKRKEMLGGLPVLILAGDDYQLPGMQEGAFQALTKHGGSRMTQKGRTVLLRCAENVLQLQTIRRVGDSQQRDKEMVERIRLGVGVLDQDVERLQSLHLHKIGQRHGQDVVKQIEKEAVYIFWTNEKRVQRNLAQLLELNTDENPTAIIKPKGQGSKYGKSINAHFDTDTPSASLLCIGAKVCLNGPNLYPSWGLHTGACGIVQEIVFEKGHNPNNGDHPKYVVVHFPQYIGPPWDIDKPKVCTMINSVFPNVLLLLCYFCDRTFPFRLFVCLVLSSVVNVHFFPWN